MPNNYIAGEWVASKEAVENRNPSDISDLIGQYAVEFFTSTKTAYISTGPAS